MWVPESAEQIAEFAENNDLNETASFDAKAPDALDSTKEMAKDIAAMSTDGGVILYGVAEDEHGNPTVLQPFELKDTEERISNAVQTCIQPSPQIEVIPFPLDDDPSEGFVAVRVPPSPEAPHMVTKNKDSRYYGRNGPRNVRLQAGQVERLFRQREKLRDDRQSLLDELGDHATIKPEEEREGIGYMRVALQAPFGGNGILEPILAPDSERYTRTNLNQLIQQADSELTFAWDDRDSDSFVDMPQWNKDLSGYTANLWERGSPHRRRDAWLGFDGRMYFTVGEVAKRGPNGQKVFYEGHAAKIATKLLLFTGMVFDGVDYRGPVDIAMRVSGLKGAQSAYLASLRARRENILDNDENLSDTRVYVTKLLRNPVDVTRSLLGRLINVSSMGHGEQLLKHYRE
jgi:hypothetical protein